MPRFPRRLRRKVWWLEILAGTLIAVSRFFLLFGILFGSLWIYAIVLNPESPAKVVLPIVIAFLVIWGVLRLFIGRLMIYIKRASKIYRRYYHSRVVRCDRWEGEVAS